ncbi:hypothetical protein HMN09_00022900 [Mycena chlorophos]|uniref:Uncharacterized protein n=1 Tax=Mycena chlorophos TaxID=658473 RepID=A0A8H6TTA9_MYCCL|nr:hypothetical protein HMN09_00022900 [Mycena chlorophos]
MQPKPTKDADMYSPLRLIRPTYQHEFFVLDVPGEKYGHHVVLAYHAPKRTFRKVAAVWGRMEKEIAAAKCVGSVPLSQPFDIWEGLEEDANYLKKHTFGELDAAEFVQQLVARRAQMQGKPGVVDVPVYLVKVKTRRKNVLYDGDKDALPAGYLTFFGQRPSAAVDDEEDTRVQCAHQ